MVLRAIDLGARKAVLEPPQYPVDQLLQLIFTEMLYNANQVGHATVIQSEISPACTAQTHHLWQGGTFKTTVLAGRRQGST